MTITASVTGHSSSAVAQERRVSIRQSRSSAESAAQEAEETPAVTRQEAGKGDRVAQRKLAKEEAAKSTSANAVSEPIDASQSSIGNTGRLLSVVA